VTDDQFEALRGELRAVRNELRDRLGAMDRRLHDADLLLTKLEARLAAKPDNANSFRTAYTVTISLLAAIGLAAVIASTL